MFAAVRSWIDQTNVQYFTRETYSLLTDWKTILREVLKLRHNIQIKLCQVQDYSPIFLNTE